MTTHGSHRAAPLVGGLLALLLAACSGAAAAPSGVATLASHGASGASGDPAASPSLSPADAALAFAKCMREHGVAMDDPTFEGGGVSIGIDGSGIDPKAMQAAQEACGGFMGGGDPGRTIPPEELDKLVAFASCMREHGIDMPDPQTSGGMVTIGGPDSEGGKGIDPRSPEFQAAQEACQALLPGGGPGGGGPAIQVGPGNDQGGTDAGVAQPATGG